MSVATVATSQGDNARWPVAPSSINHSITKPARFLRALVLRKKEPEVMLQSSLGFLDFASRLGHRNRNIDKREFVVNGP
jgi:hypothetical protein